MSPNNGPAGNAFKTLAVVSAAIVGCGLVAAAVLWRTGEREPVAPVPPQAPGETDPPASAGADRDASLINLSVLSSPNPGYVGPEACAECHQENYEGASQTHHFRACRPVEAEQMPDGFDGDIATFGTNDEGLRFEMHQEGDQFWMHTVKNRGDRSQRLKSRLDLVLGSGGKFDDVFLSWRDDGWMYELPMVWLYPTQQWATSHFDPHAAGDHSRPLTVRCLECHNTWVDHVVGTANQYRRDGAILGVTCESCHGPASEHVNYHRENPDATQPASIVYPAELDREQQIAVCSQCHSNAMKRRGPAFSHRPDQPLEESFQQLTTEHHEDDHVANQTKFMKQSACFQRDQSMTCVTCHDPHTRPAESGLGSHACNQCHQQEDCNDHANLPVALREQCVDCHMPPYIKINVNFRTQDDNFVTPIRRWQHRIAVYPEARQELLRDWFAEQEDAESAEKAEELTDQLVTFYLDRASECRDQHRYLGAIAAAREAQRIDDRPEVREVLQDAVDQQTDLERLRATANLNLRQRQLPRAIEVFEEILQVKPDDAVVHGRLGTTLAQMGQSAQGVEHWEAVAQHDPNDAYGLGMLAWVALQDDRLEEAITYYRQADEIEPYEAKIKYHIGWILARQNNLSDALPYFRKALEIEPLHPDALRAIIGTLRQLGRADDAIPYVLTALEVSGGEDIDTLMVLAETSAEAAKYDDAIRAATQARSLAAELDQELAVKIDERLEAYRSGRDE